MKKTGSNLWSIAGGLIAFTIAVQVAWAMLSPLLAPMAITLLVIMALVGGVWVVRRIIKARSESGNFEP